MTGPVPVTGEGGADAYARLAEMGVTLPQVVPPLAAYVPAVQSGNQVYVSGQLPMVDGKLPLVGKVGAEVTPEQVIVIRENSPGCASYSGTEIAGETTSDSMLKPRREKISAMRTSAPGLLRTSSEMVWSALLAGGEWGAGSWEFKRGPSIVF